jgi:acetyl esterase/lipase
MKLFKSLLLLSGSLLALCACSGLEALNFITPRSGYSVVKNIAYGNGPRQQLDVYVPAHPAPGHPVLVFFYGGSWQGGSKDDYRFAGQAFASKGFYTVIADYRVYPEVYFPAFMDDGAAAFVWAHEHIAEYGGNPENLFLSGHSAGGHIAILLALDAHYIKAAGGQSSWIKGGIGIAGPYDFLPFTDPKIKAVFSHVDVAQSQPINYVRPGLPPLLLLTGDADTQVLPRNAHNLTAKLEKDHDPVTKIVYPGVGHIGIILAIANNFHSKAPTLDDIARFVNAHSIP